MFFKPDTFHLTAGEKKSGQDGRTYLQSKSGLKILFLKKGRDFLDKVISC